MLKQNPSILSELADLNAEIEVLRDEGHQDEMLGYVEQFIILEHEGLFAGQTVVTECPVWSTSGEQQLSPELISERAQMKVQTDPDYGEGMVFKLHAGTGCALPLKNTAVITYLDLGETLTIQHTNTKMTAQHTPDLSKNLKKAHVFSVGASLSSSHYTSLTVLPSEPHVIMVTAEWVCAIPAEKKNFKLKTYDGGEMLFF